MNEIKLNQNDRLALLARGVLGACPVIGPLAAEVVASLIPAQRTDRIITFLQALEKRVSDNEAQIERVNLRLKSEEGIDLLEEGLVQATRSISAERLDRLARIVGESITQESFAYAQARKLLNLYRELTDPEIIWLIFFATKPSLGSEYHREFAERYPEVLKPVSREVGVPQEQIDEAAIQDSYKNTLVRFGLLEVHGRSYRITSLGRLLVRYIGEVQ